MGQNEKMDFGFDFHKVLWDNLFISAVVCYDLICKPTFQMTICFNHE